MKREKILDLLRRVVQEFGNHFHGAHRSDDGGDDEEVHRETPQALRGGEALPGLRVLHQSSSPRSRTSLANTLRTRTASTSPIMMSAMMESRMAHTKS